jgi:hypothetical protein
MTQVPVALVCALALSATAPAPASAWASEPCPVPAAATAASDTIEVRLPSGLSFREMQNVLGALRGRAGTSPGGRGPEVVDGVSRLEIDGLVIDETVTKIGRDFFDVFRGAWEPPDGVVNYTIRIQEQPVPTLGTRVVLLLDDEPLFQLQLEPRYEVIEDLARQAAQFTAQELMQRSPVPPAVFPNGPVGSGPAP